MQASLLYIIAATPALAWTQPRFGYVPGNDFGVPQNASYDYVIVGGGPYKSWYSSPCFTFDTAQGLLA
jgi:hypothetical protein